MIDVVDPLSGNSDPSVDDKADHRSVTDFP